MKDRITVMKKRKRQRIMGNKDIAVNTFRSRNVLNILSKLPLTLNSAMSSFSNLKKHNIKKLKFMISKTAHWVTSSQLDSILLLKVMKTIRKGKSMC
jgi:hypothetical protein